MGQSKSNYKLLFSFVLLLFTAQGFADEVTDSALKLLQQQQVEQAYQLLAPLEDERAGDPEYDYLLGISALDSDRVTQAVFALERVLAVDPTHDRARAEIARAYFLLGETETARQEFATVSEQAPPEARQTIDRYLALIERSGAAEAEGTEINGYIDLALGYDSNINSATNQSQVALPILGNVRFQLVDDARENGSEFLQVSGAVNVSHPVADNVRLIGGARGFNRITEAPFSTRDAYGYAGFVTEHGRHRFTAAGNYENFAIDNNTLRNVYGGFGQWTYALTDASRVNLSIQGSVIEYINIPTRDVDRYVVSAGYIKAFDHPREPLLFLGAYGGTEDEHDNNFPQFGHDLYGFRAGGRVLVYDKLRAFANVGVEQRDYNGPDTIFQTKRDDTQVFVSGGVEYEYDDNWKVIPEISYLNNDSNVPLNDFDRIVGSVKVRYTF